MSQAFVYDAVRTPFGRHGGGLADLRPDDLAAHAIGALLARSPDLDPGRVDEVVLGNANGAGEDNRNVARMAVLLAGLPVTVPATTVNRLCGSSLDALMIGSRIIQSGDARIIVVGGVESMTRAPWVLPKPARGFPAADVTAVSSTLGWRLVNPRMPAEWTVSLGEANEQLGAEFEISRERQDEFALQSHLKAAQAWDDGFYEKHVVPCPGSDLVMDEGVRADVSADGLSRLKPAFRVDGTITAGNASPLSDGASALLLGDETAADVIGHPPVARIVSRASVACAPQRFGFAPVEAADIALRRAGCPWDEVDAVELNEAFAVQSIACIDAWGIDPALVNPRGGAIAIGHPLGASGGRLVATLLNVLRENGGRVGVAAICIGVGQGLAVVVERA